MWPKATAYETNYDVALEAGAFSHCGQSWMSYKGLRSQNLKNVKDFRYHIRKNWSNLIFLESRNSATLTPNKNIFSEIYFSFFHETLPEVSTCSAKAYSVLFCPDSLSVFIPERMGTSVEGKNEGLKYIKVIEKLTKKERLCGCWITTSLLLQQIPHIWKNLSGFCPSSTILSASISSRLLRWSQKERNSMDF